MKRMKVALVTIMFACTLSACGQTEDFGNLQMNMDGSTKEIGDVQMDVDDSTKEIYEEKPQVISGEAEADAHEEESGDYDAGVELERLTGEYEYLSDHGTGKLAIAKTAYGYDISDYESESSYRFLADLSNVETIQDNRIYLKYPEQVLSDGTAVFGYYILEYGTDEINVYYGTDSFDEAAFLYHAVKKTVKKNDVTADDLLDSFVNGLVSAVDSADLTSTFYITDLNMDSEEWDAYSIGEKVDLDNDGENELVINGPYGGIYLDARNNMVYEFAAGDGNAVVLSYTCYNGAVWIMYSNRSSAGFESYHMEKFEGADNLTAEMNFGEEPADFNNAEAGMKYTLNDAEISYDEYTELCSKIFAAEVNTN